MQTATANRVSRLQQHFQVFTNEQVGTAPHGLIRQHILETVEQSIGR